MKIFTFGCKVNQVESEDMEKSLEKFDTKNVIIVNSCTVTSRADQKCRQLLNSLIKKYPQYKIILTGCYSERDKDVLNNKYPNIVLIKNIDKCKIGKILNLKNKETKKTKNNRTRAFLKIQDGCNNFCSYCIVPYVRPDMWSKPFDDIEKQVKEFIKNGYKEIVVTGVKLGSYNYNGLDLIGVLEFLCKFNEIKRIRISSIEPKEINDKFINFISENALSLDGKKGKICTHLHIPIQSGDNEILDKMNRKYNTLFIKNLINKLRAKIPNLRITSDVIIGFPDEQEANFSNTLNFIKKLKLDGLHIFPFSPRLGTKAYDMDNKIDLNEINRRKKIIQNLDLELRKNSLKKLIDKEIEVLLENETEDNKMQGLSSNYARILVSCDKRMCGNFVLIKPKQIDIKWPVILKGDIN